jgi:stress response protein YsnF
MIINYVKADHQDDLEERTKENQEAVKISTSRNVVDVDGSEVCVDGKSLNDENLVEINGALPDQDIAEVKLDELKNVEDFKSHKEEWEEIKVEQVHRHTKRHDHATIGRGNIFRLWKDKGWNTVEFYE